MAKSERKEENKNPVGRPSKYDPAFCEIVLDKMTEGAAVKELPFYLDCHLDSIYEWAKVHPEFSDALKKGVERSEAWWMREGRLALREKDFSYTGWYMNMKNRFGWSDKTESSHDVKISETKEKLTTHDY